MATYSSKKYPSGSVTSAQLADGTVVAVDLADGAVTSAKLNSTVDLSGKTVTYRSIVAGDIASGAITTAKIADANITPAKMANSGAELGSRNRIINGAMVIDQRNAGASVTPTATVYGLDRWKMAGGVASKYSFQQNASSVTPPAGFVNYLGITSLSAYTVGASETFVTFQYIEGYTVADLGWGTANAKTVTLSFWVRSSLTGTFGGSLGNVNATRSYPFTYTISSANTWEQKSITIAGDTSGTWNTTNGTGLALYLGFGVGSTLSGTAGAWAGAEYYSATGSVSVVGTSGATFYITGVQLEKGTTATSFDYRPYGTELQLCQRYYSKSFSIGTAPVQNSGLYTWYATLLSSGYGYFSQIYLPVAMRAVPTITGYNGGAANALVRTPPAGQDITNTVTPYIWTTSFLLQCWGGAGDWTSNPIGWNWSASAEL